jgi:hypothetical protein
MPSTRMVRPSASWNVSPSITFVTEMPSAAGVAAADANVGAMAVTGDDGAAVVGGAALADKEDSAELDVVAELFALQESTITKNAAAPMSRLRFRTGT